MLLIGLDAMTWIYVVFVVKPGTCGQLVFSVSYAEAQRRAAAYQRARAAKGGSPTTCPG